MNQNRWASMIRQLLRGTQRGGSRRWTLLILAGVLGYVVLRPVLERQLGVSLPELGNPTSSTSRTDADGQQTILDAFASRQSNLIVSASARIKRLLRDDDVGHRHQKMILELDSGHTLLLAHNIDLAPRVPAAEGDRIEFKGEYEYSEQGGVIHWTHHDPAGRHAGGWIRHQGELYE
ncbi:MAG: DUF3465 domain-containing protein [Planctomycetota bacterium]